MINVSEQRSMYASIGLSPTLDAPHAGPTAPAPVIGLAGGAGEVDVRTPPHGREVRSPRWCSKCHNDFKQSVEVTAGLARHFPSQPGCNCTTKACSDCWKRAVAPLEPGLGCIFSYIRGYHTTYRDQNVLFCFAGSAAARMSFCPHVRCLIQQDQRAALHSAFQSIPQQQGICDKVGPVGEHRLEETRKYRMCACCGKNTSALAVDTVLATLGGTSLCGCGALCCDNCWRLAIKRHSGPVFLSCEEGFTLG